MCGRMASRSKAPASPRVDALAIDTVKWLAQNITRRSVKGRAEAAALARWARTSACTRLRKCSTRRCSALRASAVAIAAAPGVSGPAGAPAPAIAPARAPAAGLPPAASATLRCACRKRA